MRTTARSSSSSSRFVMPTYRTSGPPSTCTRLCQSLLVEVVEPAVPLDEQVGAHQLRQRRAVARVPGHLGGPEQRGGMALELVGREVGVVLGRLRRRRPHAQVALAHLAAVEPRAEDEVQDQETPNSPEHHDRDERISLAGAGAASEALPPPPKPPPPPPPPKPPLPEPAWARRRVSRAIGGQHRTRLAPRDRVSVPDALSDRCSPLHPHRSSRRSGRRARCRRRAHLVGDRAPRRAGRRPAHACDCSARRTPSR